MDGFLSDWLQMLLEDSQGGYYQNQKQIRCPRCQMVWKDFQNSGLLGCGECYQTFAKELSSIIGQLQGSKEHKGKVPVSYHETLSLQRKIMQLKEELQRLAKAEKFEEAAKVRDAIRDLEQEGAKEHENR